VLNSQPQYGREYPVPRYQPWDPFSDFFECKGGDWISVAGKNYEQSKEYYADLFDLPELLTQPEYETLATIRDTGNLERLAEHVAGKMAERTAQEWAEVCESNDIPYEILRHFSEVSHDEQAWANGVFENIEYKDGVVTAMPTPPIIFPEYDRVSCRPLGGVGEYTNEVLRGLGYTDEEIEEMRAGRAVL
jgi:crotonobetainyl-CoA:carnitine CoA-transferase CaiB-like acyl-CoA transferase